MRYLFPITLLLFFLPLFSFAQPCSDPVSIVSIAITPDCGTSNGAIEFFIPAGDYDWQWSPGVAAGPTAQNLPAGDYAVHIERTGQLNCFLDTVITVGFIPNGIDVQIIGLQPSNCLASNGIVSLSPVNLNYVWSNGETGAFNEGLNSGTYTVTATDPGSSCKQVLNVTVPNLNPLDFTFSIDYPSKCGRPTGKASFNISGGSGQYAYSLGGTQVFGLPAGPGMAIVIDNVTSCADTAFFEIPVATAAGEAVITVNPPLCSGGLGNVSVSVIPGVNFATPYTFSITTSGGVSVGAGALPAGNYLLYVTDADSCVLPVQSFSIIEPPPLEAAITVMNGDCNDGGQADLQITGGTGNYYIDWTDLDGINNAPLRSHLREGRYHVFVYDSLFCKDSITDILVKNLCSRRDTFHLLVPAGASNHFCIPSPVGFSVGETSYQLLSGNNSTYGNWLLNGNCLEYNALNTTGFNLDLVSFQATAPGLMAVDTICVWVSIVAATSAETVQFTTQVNTSTAACGTIPPAIQNRKTFPLNAAGFSGFTAFGDYELDENNSCIAYTSFDTPQFFADSIAVATCDMITLKCHTISYVPSILPYYDCTKGIIQEDSLTLPTVECVTGTSACLKIPYADILNFNILDNATPYILGAAGCNEGPVTAYNIVQLPMALIPGGGPYFLEEWLVNGVPHSGAFGNLLELVALMNQIDPSPGWYTENPTKIIGGATASTYGHIKVTNTSNLTGLAPPIVQSAPLGSALQFSTGDHFVILKKIQTGCADTLRVTVQCENCPAIHQYPSDTGGNIQWETQICSKDSLFLTSLPLNALSEWTISDNGTPFTKIVPQGNNAALLLDTGIHLLIFRNSITTCEYLITLNFECTPPLNGDQLIIYTGISPNNDGKNDSWYISNLDRFPGNEVWVYNYSGNEVFHEKGYNNLWTGTWNGKLLPDGIYYYIVDPGDGRKLLRGNLTIQR